MKYLIPTGGEFDGYGVLTSPGHRGIAWGIASGKPWAADNQAFTKGFDPGKFYSWLESMEPYKSTCIFVACPDVVGNAEKTIELYYQYRPYFGDWPVAFVAQDGQERLDFPEYFSALFVGGTTEWKLSAAAADCIRRAQEINKRIHIGRVNWYRRYHYFRSLPGSDDFTCDGTRIRYGRDQALKDWREYETRERQIHFPIPDSDYSG